MTTKPVLFTLKLIFEGEDHSIDYTSFTDCFLEDWLRSSLDQGEIVCSVWCEGQEISSRPITGSSDLRAFLVANSSKILHRFRK